MIIVAKQKQSIYDLATQYCGSSEYAMLLLRVNNKPDEDVIVGEQLYIPDEWISQRTKSFFHNKGLDIGCLDQVLNDDEYVPDESDEHIDVSVNHILYKMVYANRSLDISIKNSVSDFVSFHYEHDDVIIKDTEVNVWNNGVYIGTAFVPIDESADIDAETVQMPGSQPINIPPVNQGGNILLRVNRKFYKSVPSEGDVNISMLNTLKKELTYMLAGDDIVLNDQDVNILVNQMPISSFSLPAGANQTINT
ncbi:MAG: hypothetical protein LC105_04275 [Chitinophagales bacterium]|nr:hypothetical protein [Chitinophagales bacterium]